MKTKIKFYGDEATNFHHKEISKVDSNLTCLVVISFDSALNKDGKYYPQVFLKECKCIKKVMIRHITKDIEIFLMILMSLIKNSLFFKESLKMSQKWDKVFHCKLFFYLDYPYTLDHKKVLLIILVTSYTGYQILLALCSRLKKCLDHNTKQKLHSLTNSSSMVDQKFLFGVK